jgi:hypothetical protein
MIGDCSVSPFNPGSAVSLSLLWYWVYLLKQELFPRPSLKTGTARQHKGVSPLRRLPSVEGESDKKAPARGRFLGPAIRRRWRRWRLWRGYFCHFFEFFFLFLGGGFFFSLMNRLASALFLPFFTWASQLLYQIISDLVSFVDRKSNFPFRQLLNAAY